MSCRWLLHFQCTFLFSISKSSVSLPDESEVVANELFRVPVVVSVNESLSLQRGCGLEPFGEVLKRQFAFWFYTPQYQINHAMKLWKPFSFHAYSRLRPSYTLSNGNAINQINSHVHLALPWQQNPLSIQNITSSKRIIETHLSRRSHQPKSSRTEMCHGARNIVLTWDLHFIFVSAHNCSAFHINVETK